MTKKVPYICGALTELPEDMQWNVKSFYSALGDITENALGCRAFVPHEHHDPVAHAHFSPTEVYDAETKRLREETSLLVVVGIAPTWGGGGEVQIAKDNGIPIIILRPHGKKLSRFLLGGPCIRKIIDYTSESSATAQFIAVLTEMKEELCAAALATTA